MFQLRYIPIIVLITTVATIPLPTLASDDDTALRRGKLLAREKCSVCHSIEHTGVSPYPTAPPFRDIAKRYPVEGLAEALAEGIYVGHPMMPEFVLPPGQIGDPLTYMDTFSK